MPAPSDPRLLSAWFAEQDRLPPTWRDPDYERLRERARRDIIFNPPQPSRPTETEQQIAQLDRNLAQVRTDRAMRESRRPITRAIEGAMPFVARIPLTVAGGMVGGVPGLMAGAAAGSALAQRFVDPALARPPPVPLREGMTAEEFEAERLAQPPPEELKPGPVSGRQVALETALAGFLPGPASTPLRTFVKQAAANVALGASYPAAHALAVEGRLPTREEVTAGAGYGGAVGLPIAALMAGAQRYGRAIPTPRPAPAERLAAVEREIAATKATAAEAAAVAPGTATWKVVADAEQRAAGLARQAEALNRQIAAQAVEPPPVGTAAPAGPPGAPQSIAQQLGMSESELATLRQRFPKPEDFTRVVEGLLRRATAVRERLAAGREARAPAVVLKFPAAPRAPLAEVLEPKPAGPLAAEVAPLRIAPEPAVSPRISQLARAGFSAEDAAALDGLGVGLADLNTLRAMFSDPADFQSVVQAMIRRGRPGLGRVTVTPPTPRPEAPAAAPMEPAPAIRPLPSVAPAGPLERVLGLEPAQTPSPEVPVKPPVPPPVRVAPAPVQPPVSDLEAALRDAEARGLAEVPVADVRQPPVEIPPAARRVAPAELAEAAEEARRAELAARNRKLAEEAAPRPLVVEPPPRPPPAPTLRQRAEGAGGTWETDSVVRFPAKPDPALRQELQTEGFTFRRDPETRNGAWVKAGAGQPAVGQVPRNVRDFLVRQLKYTPEDVAAMSPEEAARIGNQVRQHPEAEGGIRGGIAKYRRPPAPPPEAGPPVPAREAPSAVPPVGPVVEAPAVPRGTPEPVAPKAEAMQALRQRQVQNLAEVKDAEKLLDIGSAEALEEYARRIGAVAEREWAQVTKRGLDKGGGGPPQASMAGTGYFEWLAKNRPEQFWWALRTVGGGLVGSAVADATETDPLLGFLGGAVAAAAGPALFRSLRRTAPTVAKRLSEVTRDASVGVKATLPVAVGGQARPKYVPHEIPPVRRATTGDISWLESKLGQPFRTVPQAWKKVTPILEDFAQLERTAPSATPEIARVTRQLYLRETVEQLYRSAQEAAQAGQRNAAGYIRAMADEMRGVPTWYERGLSDTFSRMSKAIGTGEVKVQHIRAVERAVTEAIYFKLLGFALDSAVLNRTQVLYALPYIGPKYLLKGMRMRSTPQGQFLSEHLNIAQPADLGEALAKLTPGMKPSLARKIVNLAHTPMRLTDQANRKDVFLGTLAYAQERMGLNKAAAREFAMDVTTQTQGWPGELGANPFHRQLGPVRILTKFPTIWAQMLMDFAAHPDPQVRRGGIGLLLGVPALAGAAALAVGTSAVGAVQAVSKVIIPRTTLTLPAVEAAGEAAALLTGTSKYGAEEYKGAPVPRYLLKVKRELSDFARFGFRPHEERSATGLRTGEHTAAEGLLGLLNITTPARAQREAKAETMYREAADLRATEALRTRRNRIALTDAIKANDADAIREALSQMTPTEVREYARQRNLSEEERIRRSVPTRRRPEFDEAVRAPAR